MSDATEIILAVQEHGGIPIKLVSETNWAQFGLTLSVAAIGSVFIFLWIWHASLKPIFAQKILNLKLRKLHKKTGRHYIIIKHTESALFSQSMINIDTVMDVEKAIIKFEGKPFDLILHTPGGSIFVSQRLGTLFKNYPGEIRAVIPMYAMSGGALLALCCDKILMDSLSCIGPVDPQIGSLFNSGSARSYKEIIKKKGRKSHDDTFKFEFMGQQYTNSIREFLRPVLAEKITDPDKVESTLEYITSGNIEHSRQIMKEDLTELGIPVDEMDPEIFEIARKIITSKLFEGVFAT